MRRVGVIVLGLFLAGCGRNTSDPEPFWAQPESWVFEDSSLWAVSGDTLNLVRAGSIPSDIRRPGSVATVEGTNELTSFHLRAEIRSTQDTSVVGRDVIMVFGYQSPRRFYYAHLSNDNTVMPHNGIFLVNEQDRRRIDEPGMADPPETRLHDERWHRVRLDRDAATGSVRVFVDNLRQPLMTASDTTFRTGAIGFGSFDDTGAIRGLKWAKGPAPLLDPVEEHPGEPRLSIRLEPYARIPASDTTGGPIARINYLTHSGDGSGRLFVPDLRGVLHVIEDGSARPYLDVTQSFPDFVDSPGLGSGLGFVAFDPEFEANGRFYTVHTEAGRSLTEKRPDHTSGDDIIHGVITEWTTDPGAEIFTGTHREVLRLGFRAVLHGIQQIGFNPLSNPGDDDFGLLYIAVGDGEAPGMQTNRPQSLAAHNGKIFRIDPAGSDSPNGGYGIPVVNPFAGQKNTLGEIWALGLRNPHRFSWDSETGQMLISHIGEARVDAIFPGIEGANYGWNEREGGFRYEKADPLEVYPLEMYSVAARHQAFTEPVIRMDHDDMSALVGGFVYRGNELEALNGTYLFADLASGRIFESRVQELREGSGGAAVRHVSMEDVDGNETSMAELAGRSRAEIRFGKDDEGEMFILSKANGMIWKLTGASSLDAKVVMAEGSWTGVLSPMNHPEQMSPLTFSVAYQDSELVMALVGPGDMAIPIRNIQLQPDSLAFEFNEPEGDFLLTCALTGAVQTGFEGRCTDETGKWAFVRLAPPGS